MRPPYPLDGSGGTKGQLLAVPTEVREAALVSKAWPYEEARKLLKRYPDGPGAGEIVFETGYGPSGLPHSAHSTSLRRRWCATPHA